MSQYFPLILNVCLSPNSVLVALSPWIADSCVPKQGIKTLLDVAFNMLGW